MRSNHIFLFIILVLIQLLVLDSLYISTYIAPLISVAFITLLPSDSTPMSTLLLSLLMGAAIDLLSGYMGLNTIALLVVGYTRPTVLRLVAGEDIFRERSTPDIKRLGNANFILYSFIMSFIMSLFFFSFESLDATRIIITALKIVCSSIATTILTYITAMVFSVRQH